MSVVRRAAHVVADEGWSGLAKRLGGRIFGRRNRRPPGRTRPAGNMIGSCATSPSGRAGSAWTDITGITPSNCRSA